VLWCFLNRHPGVQSDTRERFESGVKHSFGNYDANDTSPNAILGHERQTSVMAASTASQPLSAPDAVSILERRTPAERHAIARLLDTREAIDLLGWIADQPDCDRATASMIFWRMLSIPGRYDGPEDFAARNALLSRVLGRCRDGGYPSCDIAWDGLEAWERSSLIDASPVTGVQCATESLPPMMRGPFGHQEARPAWDTLLDEDIAWDDIFDSMWCRHPDDAGVADYLIRQGAAVWLAAIDDLISADSKYLLEWMARQPECPKSAAGRIAHLLGQDWSDFRSGGEPTTHGEGETRQASRPNDFSYFCLIGCRGGLLPRPRAAAIAEWQKATASAGASREFVASAQGRPLSHAEPAATAVERFCYGGKFTGAQAQMDRCWRRFNMLFLCGGVTLLILMRAGAPHIAFAVFLALVAFVSVAQSSWKMGSSIRLVTWWILVIGVVAAFTGIFRTIDYR